MERKIKNYSLSDQIYHLLKEAITKGELKPGDRIVELEVARTYGVSQAPVREALSRLKEENFVVSHRHKGTFVSNFSMKDIQELYSFREIMEPFAIRRAMERIKDEDVDALEEIYTKMVSAGKENNLDSVRQLDIEFHSLIYRMADHNFMYQVWEQLSSKANRIWYLTTQYYFKDLLELAKIHKPIVESFRKRDPEKTVEEFLKHLDFVKLKIVKGLKDEQEESE